MKKIIAIVVGLSIICSSQISVFAYENTMNSESITMEEIYDEEEREIYISDETLFYNNSSKSAQRSYGTYPISTRVRVVQSSSNGMIECDNAIGTFSSIASIALSFIPGVSAMTVSTIFSVVGIVAGQNQYSQAITYKSYIDYQKQGEAKWADESTYTPYVYSGKRNYYKHVMATKMNSNGTWTGKVYNYTSTPARTDTSTYYNNSDSWFKNQAYDRCVSGLILYDLPW